MKKTLLTAILWLGLCLPLEAVGTVGASFLRYEHSARVVGMGGAFVALADDGDAVYWNPAGLAFLSRRSFTFTHCHGFIDTRQEYLNAVWPFGHLGTLGVDFLYASVGKLNLYDDFGLKIGEMENYDAVLDGAWGYPLAEDLALGGGLKLYYSGLADSFASGVAFDAGVLAREIMPGFSVGSSLTNIGPGITYIEVSDPLPLTFRLGAAYSLPLVGWHGLTLTSELNRLLKQDDWLYLNNGAEYSYQGRYFLRGGYRLNRAKDKLSLGAGVHLGDIRADYALLPFGHLGLTHRVSFGYDLPLKRPEPAPLPSPTPTAAPTPPPLLTIDANTEKVLLIPTGVSYFHLSLSKGVALSTWELEIADENGQPVRTFSGSETPPPALLWYGKSEHGKLVPSGFYSYRLRGEDALGREVESARKELIIKEQEEIRFKLPAELIFALGSVEPTTRGLPKLADIADIIVTYYPAASVKIEGHTDNVPLTPYSAFKSNRELSQIRAQSVADYLIKRGVKKNRITPKGFGDTQPIADNSTRQGRAANRRVEIIISTPDYVIKLGGSLEQDTLLRAVGSPYLIVDDLMVQDSATLTIEPGVVLRFAGGMTSGKHGYSPAEVDLVVKGKLVAEGVAGKGIRFEPSTEKDWGAVRFSSCRPGSVLSLCRIIGGWIGCDRSSPRITNCIIENSRGIELGQESSPLLRTCLLRGNEIGLACHKDTAAPRIQHCFFENNGIAILLRNFDRLLIKDCSFKDNEQNLVNLSPKQVDASGNYWDTTEVEVIREGISDGEDKPGCGMVIFEPFLLEKK